MENEIWKPVPNYEGLYFASDRGRIKSFCKNKGGKIMKLTNSGNGYLRVELRKNKGGALANAHRVIAKSFIPNPANKPIVGHLNNNPSDNNVANLCWLTQSENLIQASRQDRLISKKGAGNNMAKLTEDSIKEIRNLAKNGNLSTTYISKLFNISISNASQIINNKRWGHI